VASLIERNGTYYLQWYVGRKLRRRSLRTDVLQVAKEKLRQFESAQHRGIDDSLPTRTPIADVVNAYVEHVRAVKTPKSAQTNVYYLREAFGAVWPALEITSRKVSEASRKRPRKPGQDRRCNPVTLEAACFEAITTADVSTFIGAHTRSRGLAPKTANRYREIIVRLFNWAMEQRGVRMPGDRNPAASVERYQERAPEIRYLTLPQIDEQLEALKFKPQLQAMVAMYIYAGLRREEALWLTVEDVNLRAGRCGLIHGDANRGCFESRVRGRSDLPVAQALRGRRTELPHSVQRLTHGQAGGSGHRHIPCVLGDTGLLRLAGACGRIVG
jgi:integrase